MRSVWSSDLGHQHSGQGPGLRSRGRRRRTLRERTYPSAGPPHVARVPHFCSTTSWERTPRAVTACALHLDGWRTPCSLSFHRAVFLGAPQESRLRRRGCLDARRVAVEAPSCYRQWGQSRHEMSSAQTPSSVHIHPNALKPAPSVQSSPGETALIFLRSTSVPISSWGFSAMMTS